VIWHGSRTMTKAFITGLGGAVLTADEAAFLSAAHPAGIILFARNCETPAQVRALTDAARRAAGDDLLVLIDQEGGRVQRLRPPHWRALPPAAAYLRGGQGDARTAAQLAGAVARLTAMDLRALGINANCAPVLDVPVPGSHEIIGDRAYATDVATVVMIARAVADGYLAGGVLPIIKHIPGHGRAMADSHVALPSVETSALDLDVTDFAPFWALAMMPAAMTAHVVYTALDASHPATTSPRVIGDLIRRRMGFGGLLMSDDLSMKALSGDMASRAQDAIRAGCDLALHCNGDMAEMTTVAAHVPELIGSARLRFERALALTRTGQSFDVAEAEAALARVMPVA
jgi:beta-N-acetylhexosaminidase